jgi:hypothetical protein
MTIRVAGLSEAIKELRKKGDTAETIIKKKLRDTADEILLDAKNDAPFGPGLSIKQRLDANPFDGGLRFEIGVQGTLDIDAYYEFGTGLSAQQILSNPLYTNEMRDLAMMFFKDGKGRLRGTPYLFPNYIKHTSNLVEELKKEISKL